MLYPPAQFPGLWARIEALVASGDIVSSDEVRLEIERKDDDVHAWCKERRSMFLPLSAEVQEAATSLLRAFPRLVDARTGKSMADPFVIATAQVHAIWVVTQERATGRPRRPKIPDACLSIGIRCATLLDLIKAEGWVFS